MPDDYDTDDSEIIPFPFAKLPGRNRNKPVKFLGYTKMAIALSPDGSGCFGHWCSHCKGVWFGYGAEVECPVCGNRRG